MGGRFGSSQGGFLSPAVPRNWSLAHGHCGSWQVAFPDDSVPPATLHEQ